MTSQDPFKPENSSNYGSDGFSVPEPAQPPQPAQPYDATQPYGSAPHNTLPHQPLPGYGAYQQPPAPHSSPGYDGVSIAAFVTGLLGTGPIAAVLGGVGLSRTARNMRSGRWMAWLGLILGVLSTLAWIGVIAFFVWIVDTTPTTPVGGGSEPSTGIFDTDATYGSDPYLDGLWDECEAGDMGACDDLYMASPFGSEYEEFGDTCGERGRPLLQMYCDN